MNAGAGKSRARCASAAGQVPLDFYAVSRRSTFHDISVLSWLNVVICQLIKCRAQVRGIEDRFTFQELDKCHDDAHSPRK